MGWICFGRGTAVAKFPSVGNTILRFVLETYGKRRLAATRIGRGKISCGNGCHHYFSGNRIGTETIGIDQLHIVGAGCSKNLVWVLRKIGTAVRKLPE